MKKKRVEKNRKNIFDLCLLLLVFSIMIIVLFFILNFYFPATFYSPGDGFADKLPGYTPFLVVLWIVGIVLYLQKRSRLDEFEKEEEKIKRLK